MLHSSGWFCREAGCDQCVCHETTNCIADWRALCCLLRKVFNWALSLRKEARGGGREEAPSLGMLRGGPGVAGHVHVPLQHKLMLSVAVAFHSAQSQVPGPRSQLPSYGFCHNVLYLIDSKHAQMSPADFSWEPICTCLQLCCENLNVLDGKCYWQGIIKKKRKEKKIIKVEGNLNLPTIIQRQPLPPVWV